MHASTAIQSRVLAPDVAVALSRHDRHQLRPGLDILADAQGPVADRPVHGQRDGGVAGVGLRLSLHRLGKLRLLRILDGTEAGFRQVGVRWVSCSAKTWLERSTTIVALADSSVRPRDVDRRLLDGGPAANPPQTESCTAAAASVSYAVVKANAARHQTFTVEA